MYLLPAMAVPDLVLLTVLKHRYVKLAPINRSTLTELLDSRTCVNCHSLQISPLWNPSRTLLCAYLRLIVPRP